MPATKNAMTRYALIDRMLANRHKTYSIQDITDALNERLPELGQSTVSKRCVEKDLNYLEYDSPFDVEIEEYCIDAADKNDRPYPKRCIRYTDPTFSIFKPKLTDDEKTVLSIALETLGSFDGLDNFEWLSDLTSRLNLEEHEPVISISKNILTNSTLIARLFTTIRLRQSIKLEYHTFNKDEVKSVSVSPYLIREYNNRWFLIAAASDTGKILTFPLDRIDNFKIEYVTRYLKAPEDLIDRYEDIIGVTFYENSPLLEIIFWASDMSKDYIMTKPIHGSQILIRNEEEQTLRNRFPSLSEGAFFKLKCKENYELIRELTSFGSELIVLSPQSLNETIRCRIERMNRLYQSFTYE